MLLVVLKSVIQQHTQRHDAAVKFAILGCPVGVYEDGGLVGEDVASLSSLAVKLLLTFPFLLLRVTYTSDTSIYRPKCRQSPSSVNGAPLSSVATTASIQQEIHHKQAKDEKVRKLFDHFKSLVSWCLVRFYCTFQKFPLCYDFFSTVGCITKHPTYLWPRSSHLNVNQ